MNLECILAAHKLYVETNGKKGKPADLRGAGLPGTILTDADFGYIDLSGADLTNVCLMSADLSNANLREINLSKTDLRGANLSNASLIKANLRGANLRGANLFKANFFKADLRETDLRETDLSSVDLYGADLRGAKLPDDEVRTDFIKIGCQYYNISGWFSFDDEVVGTQATGTLKWWKAKTTTCEAYSIGSGGRVKMIDNKAKILQLLDNESQIEAINSVLVLGLLKEQQVRIFLESSIKRIIKKLSGKTNIPAWESWAGEWKSGADRTVESAKYAEEAALRSYTDSWGRRNAAAWVASAAQNMATELELEACGNRWAAGWNAIWSAQAVAEAAAWLKDAGREAERVRQYKEILATV